MPQIPVTVPEGIECPNCGKGFHRQAKPVNGLRADANPALSRVWTLSIEICPGCKEDIVFLFGESPPAGGGPAPRAPTKEHVLPFRAFPRHPLQRPVPPEVPAAIAKDYTEAQLVLALSPNAAAALARRCLQAVLRERGHDQHRLVDQIAAAVDERDPDRVLPLGQRRVIDAIRRFGNFAAHQSVDRHLGEIIDVEPGEAEFCLDLLRGLFETCYIEPAHQAKMLERARRGDTGNSS